MKVLQKTGKNLSRNDLQKIKGGTARFAGNCRTYDGECESCIENGCRCKFLTSGDIVCLGR